MDLLFFRRPGVVNVRMVITEEKILSNIDKVKKLINPNTKQQIIKLEEDAYFKDLVESITTYFKEYPDKKKFPASVYRAAHDLVEYTTSQYEENTKKVGELLDLREENIKEAAFLKEAKETVTEKQEGWIEKVKTYTGKFPSEIAKSLTTLANSSRRTEEEIKEANSKIDVKIQNLETNLFLEIDLERVNDSSKALSFIGIELAEALKYIPTPVEQVIKNTIESNNTVKAKKENIIAEDEIKNINRVPMPEEEYFNETRFNVEPSLWQKIKNSKTLRIVRNLFKIRIRIDYPALPEGDK